MKNEILTTANYLRHNQVAERLRKKGFEYVESHTMVRKEDKIVFCGSCRKFVHFISDEVVQTFNGKKYEFVGTYINDVL